MEFYLSLTKRFIKNVIVIKAFFKTNKLINKDLPFVVKISRNICNTEQ